MEKKLTDEEILKELINESNRGEWCELNFIDSVEVRVLKNAVDLIHRLQEENKDLKEERENMQDEIFGLEEEKMRLQKQVDELKQELDKAYEIERANIQAEIAEAGTSCHWCNQQTVKDTAKEIFTDMFKEIQGYENIDIILKRIAKRYGVEVEQ